MGSVVDLRDLVSDAREWLADREASDSFQREATNLHAEGRDEEAVDMKVEAGWEAEASITDAEDLAEKYYVPLLNADDLEMDQGRRQAVSSLLSLVRFVGFQGEAPPPSGDVLEEWPQIPELVAFNAYTGAVGASEEAYLNDEHPSGNWINDVEAARRLAHLEVLESVRREVVPWLLG